MAVLGIEGMPYALTFELSFADATSAPVWVDYTSRLLAGTCALSGRDYVFDVAQPGQFQFALDCSDGVLDPKYNSSMRPNNQFRIRAQATSTSPVVGIGMGYVDSYATTYPASGRDRVLLINGTDLMKYLARRYYNSGGARPAENTGARIFAILGGDVTIAGTDGYQVLLKTYPGDQKQLDIIQDLTLGAGGFFFIDGNGRATYQTPTYRSSNASSTTPQCAYVYGEYALGTTAGNADIEVIPPFQTVLDETLMANTVRVTDGAGTVVTVTDAAAETANALLEYELTTDLTNAAATTRANVLLTARKTARTRLDRVEIDALASSDAMAEVLRRKLSDRVTLKVHAKGDATGWTQDCWVESIEHRFAFGGTPEWVTGMSLSACF